MMGPPPPPAMMMGSMMGPPPPPPGSMGSMGSMSGMGSMGPPPPMTCPPGCHSGPDGVCYGDFTYMLLDVFNRTRLDEWHGIDGPDDDDGLYDGTSSSSLSSRIHGLDECANTSTKGAYTSTKGANTSTKGAYTST